MPHMILRNAHSQRRIYKPLKNTSSGTKREQSYLFGCLGSEIVVRFTESNLTQSKAAPRGTDEVKH
uniref:Ovule protein n=1 Tax=Echinococcus granulosus TaxID=6210 RepID=U6FQR5_ECHGR|nr:hypothetical protein EgrG_000308400 [Echinococcus granulosus]